MTSYLDQVPFDVAFYISSYLHLEDVVHLAQTCRRLYGLLDEPALYRATVEKYPYAEETALARSGQITFREALQAIYDRRNALSNASPLSIRVLGTGNVFLYRRGKVCMLKGDQIHILDAHSAIELVQFNLSSAIRSGSGTLCHSGGSRYTLMYYNDDILSVFLESGGRPNTGHILVISTAVQSPTSRLLQEIVVDSASKLFVRHTAQYIYYGTHTGMGSDDHHKWEITGHSLSEEHPFTEMERPILLENFHGSDIGSTVAFEIHNDQFYAVSNQGTFEVEEVDWTSFYHCVRFPLDDPTPEAVLKNERVYRRQHAQGPIHDSWTDLSLQVSEENNDIMIVESRREWEQASSRQSRTFYVSTFHADQSASSKGALSDSEDNQHQMLPEGDIYVGVLDCTNKPNWMPTPELYSWSRHPEFPQNGRSERPFPLWKTKFRAYNYSCSTFLDLVEDDRCCNDPSKPPCLRIRIGSRREKEPERATESTKGKARLENNTTAFVDSQTRYKQQPIRLWPPTASQCACSRRMHNIMNPPTSSGSHTRWISGALDGSCFVFMVKHGRPYGPNNGDNTLGTIVAVDFTRPLRTSNTTSAASTANTMPSTIPMVRTDSLLDKASTPHDQIVSEKLSWTWSPGHRSRCRAGTCQ